MIFYLTFFYSQMKDYKLEIKGKSSAIYLHNKSKQSLKKIRNILIPYRFLTQMTHKTDNIVIFITSGHVTNQDEIKTALGKWWGDDCDRIEQHLD